MTGARRFDNVSLGNMGWVRRGDGLVAWPPDGDTFAVAAGCDERCVLFYVVQGRKAIAVMAPASEQRFSWELEAELAEFLWLAGAPVVVWIVHEGPGAAVLRCYSADQDAISDAACGVWALKTIGGWDESPVITFCITHVRGVTYRDGVVDMRSRDAAWITARGELVSSSWAVDLRRVREGSWRTLNDDVAALPKPTSAAVVLADVDWLGAYADAYGHDLADLVLASVHACVEAIALAEGASCIRVGGDEFAIVLQQPIDGARRVAEAIRHAVEAMNIPFQHGEVRTHGRVTVSVAAVAADAGADLRRLVEAAVYAAKRAGRNRVAL